MSAKALFGVIVRAAGLWLVLRGIGGLFNALVMAAALHDPLLSHLGGGWLLNAVYLLGGLYLLRAAPVVVRFAYAGDDDRG